MIAPQVNAVTVLTKFYQTTEEEKFGQHKHGYLTLENLPEIMINETISLISTDDSSVKLTSIGESNNIARDRH